MTQGPTVLYPMFALVGWTFLMSLVMVRSAYRAVGEGLPVSYFRHGRGAKPPEYMLSAYQHFTNLFEMPVLFYAAVITLYATGQGDTLPTGLCWAYVAARSVHSVLHLRNTNVPRRRDAFFVSVGLLFAIWLLLFLRMLSA
ncbi:MAG: MAPEG family protein [Gammaproteobacteria bacterium]|jgi:hypothetical protein|nr:MAPEG family protein [Gammaproteobacteria bacterium]